MADWPVPSNDTGIGAHDDPNAYWKPADPNEFARDLLAHGVKWYLAWVFDENKADFINVLRRHDIEVIVRPGPAYMPRPSIDMGVIDAYVAAGARWFVLGNEYNLYEEWSTEGAWKNLDKPLRHVADWFVRVSSEIRAKGDDIWCLTPPPSLGGHMLHRDWFTRFMYALQNIAAEQGVSMEQLLHHCGIGLHCRSVGNPLEAGPDWYDCSAREWEWFDATIKSFVGHSLPMANCEAFDEPQWLPQVGSNYDWPLWESRNLEQMRWFDPNNDGYRYPLQIMCNTFWVIHADRFSPWPQCGLYSNYPHFLQRGDYTTDLWKAMPTAINWIRGEAEPPPMPPEPPDVKLRVYDANGQSKDLLWAQEKYGVKLEQYIGEGKAWHVSQIREKVNTSAGVEMFFYNDVGSPVPQLPVQFYWPGGCDCDKRTEVDGKVGFAYSSGAWIWDTSIGGPHWIEIPVEEPADRLGGLGMKAMTNHDHLDFVWKFGFLESAQPTDPLNIILPLAESLLEAIPVPNDWAYPAKAIENNHPYQVGGYNHVMIDGKLWGYQTFCNADQTSYGVAYSPENDYGQTKWALITRD